jgi:membrane-associated phospholipid phosphatase
MVPLEVTYAGVPSGCLGYAIPGLEVTVPATLDWLTVVAVGYSLVPWIGSVGLLTATAITKRYSLILCTTLLTFMITMNESLMKRALREPRPLGSCLGSYGMPSSHSLLSIGLWTYLALELTWGDVSMNGFRPRSLRQRSALLGAAAALLVPVPFARVMVGDHTTSQVVAGVSLGVLMALLFFATHLSVQRRRRRRKPKLTTHYVTDSRTLEAPQS